MTVAKSEADVKKIDGGDAGVPNFSAARAAELRVRGREAPSARELTKADLKEYAETIRILGE